MFFIFRKDYRKIILRVAYSNYFEIFKLREYFQKMYSCFGALNILRMKRTFNMIFLTVIFLTGFF